MTLQSDTPRTELIEVISVQPAMSRDGMTPQYIVGYTWQYSQYPSNFYITQSEAPDVIANFTGKFEAVVKVRQQWLKKNKDGSYKTGDKMYDYQWEVLAWESSDTPVSAPPVAEPSPTIEQSLGVAPAPQARPTDENQMRIMRQSALKCASWLSVPTVESMGIETSANKSIEIAEKFMEYFITGQVPSELDELLEEIE
tara:strand:- start:640 stop:1233 length:594 start_codon:yes stop_codon:yes gene_type:complete